MIDKQASLLKDRAFALIDAGDNQGAQSLFKQASELDQADSEALMMLGVIEADKGTFDAADTYLQQALELDPEYADVYYYRAIIRQSRGQIEQALFEVKKALQLDADFVDARNLLAKLQAAVKTAGSAVNSSVPHSDPPLSAESQQLMASANGLLQQNQLAEAITCFETLSKQNPQHSVIWFMLGRAYMQSGNFSEAVRCCNETVRIAPALPEPFTVLALALMSLGRAEEASAAADKALQLQPDNINVVAMAANIAKHMNDPEKAYKLLSPLLEKGVKQVNVALAFSMISKDLNKQQQAITMMEDILATDSKLSVPARSNLHFNLGGLYDDIVQYDSAFEHYRQGNALKPQHFDVLRFQQLIDRYITTFSSEAMAGLPRSSLRSKRPVFIIGMVRSGTSLLEHILSSHPAVYGAGELGDIYQFSKQLPQITGGTNDYPECISVISQSDLDLLAQSFLDHLTQLSPDAEKVIDKLPGNFIHLGLIELLFPDALIIHCKRDPLDTCLSTYFQDFSTVHPYAYDLENLAAYYQGYLKLMSHWRRVIKLPMLEVSYEDLIARQEEVSRSLVEFCGLPWDDSCLQFYKNGRHVRTASYDQVNRPLYAKSVARWKNYEKHLGSLIRAFA